MSQAVPHYVPVVPNVSGTCPITTLPKVALRLIKDDYDNSITLEHAREILIDSIKFEEYMHSNNIDF